MTLSPLLLLFPTLHDQPPHVLPLDVNVCLPLDLAVIGQDVDNAKDITNANAGLTSCEPCLASF